MSSRFDLLRCDVQGVPIVAALLLDQGVVAFGSG